MEMNYTPNSITVKYQKTGNKEQVLKSSRKNEKEKERSEVHYTYSETETRKMFDF